MLSLSYKIDREKRKYVIAFVLSAMIHILFLVFLNADLYRIDLTEDKQDIPEEVTIVFPENKPKQVVENINENEQIPENSDLLSDRNSRAANPERRSLSSGYCETRTAAGPDRPDTMRRSFPGR